MKRCVRCENEGGQEVCQLCKSPAAQAEGNKCPYCETVCEPFANVCSSCGHPLFMKQTTPRKNNVIPFDAKKLKKKKAKQAKKQRPPKKIGIILLWCTMAVLFVVGVFSMFF